jgi:hypothetical protein
MLCWNVEAALAHIAYSQRKMRNQESVNVRYSRRAAELAGSAAVIMAEARNAWPLPTFGPKIVALWHPNPLVPDEGARKAAVARFFRASTRDETRREIITHYGITHVLARAAAARRLEGFLDENARRQALPGGYQLYSLRPNFGQE